MLFTYYLNSIILQNAGVITKEQLMESIDLKRLYKIRFLVETSLIRKRTALLYVILDHLLSHSSSDSLNRNTIYYTRQTKAFLNFLCF